MGCDCAPKKRAPIARRVLDLENDGREIRARLCELENERYDRWHLASSARVFVKALGIAGVLFFAGYGIAVFLSP